MYRIYIFNEEFMRIIFNFGNNEYRYNEVLKNDFKESHIKYIYSKDPQNPKRLKVRVGILNNEEKRETIQYIGYTEEV